MRIHELKTLPMFFEAVLSGEKTFEARKNDRCFQKGDIILLREYLHEHVLGWHYGYSGKVIAAEITHVLTGTEWGIMDGYAMLSFKKLEGA